MQRARGLYVKTAEYNESKGFSEGVSHFHRHYEIYYMLEGRRRYIIENEIYDVVQGDVILVPPMTVHTTTYYPGAPKNERHARLLYNTYEIPEELLSCFDNHFYRPDGEVTEKLKELAQESIEDIKNGNSDGILHKINIQKFLYILFVSKSESLAPQLSPTDKAIQKAACYIKENCHKKITLKDMADISGFSREYFSVAFKKSIGSNFNDYLNNMRIARALHLLTETELPISAISEHCGFEDSNYFSYVFKKIAGVSPTKYRNLPK